MSSRRTLILVGAIVVGAIAALLILRYVGSIEDKANTDNQLVPVVVATGDVSAGEGADALIEEKRIGTGDRRRVDLPANVVTRLEDIKGQSAAINLAAGEIITTTKFSGAGELSSSKSNVLEAGNVAITVSVDQQRGVAGLVQPGDFVNLMVDLKPAPPAPVAGQTPSTLPPEDTPGAGYLFQKVKVLAIGRDVGTTVAAPAADGSATPTTAPPTSDLVTFQVPPEAAPLIAAASAKNIRMVLVRPDYQPHPVGSTLIQPGFSFPGERGLTPYSGSPAGADGRTGGSK